MEHPGCAHGASRDDGVGLLMSIIHRLDRMGNKHALDTARKALNRMLIVTEPPPKIESLINWSVLFADTRPTEAISRLAQAVELGHTVDAKYLGMVSTLQINAGRYQDAVVTLEAAIAHEGTPDDNDKAAVGRALELRMKLAETLIDTMDPFNIDASCASLVQVFHDLTAADLQQPGRFMHQHHLLATCSYFKGHPGSTNKQWQVVLRFASAIGAQWQQTGVDLPLIMAKMAYTQLVFDHLLGAAGAPNDDFPRAINAPSYTTARAVQVAIPTRTLPQGPLAPVSYGRIRPISAAGSQLTRTSPWRCNGQS